MIQYLTSERACQHCFCKTDTGGNFFLLCCRCGYIKLVALEWSLKSANIPSATDSLPDMAISEKTHKELLEESLERHKEIWYRMAKL